MSTLDAERILYASSVSMLGKGVLITGASGSGKSGLALQLMSLGAALVSDDQTIALAKNDAVMLSAPKQISGKIEARGVGILGAEATTNTPLRLVVDLDQAPEARLPERQVVTVCHQRYDLILGKDVANLAPTIIQYLKGGRID